jgi:hypothetical protein
MRGMGGGPKVRARLEVVAGLEVRVRARAGLGLDTEARC